MTHVNTLMFVFIPVCFILLVFLFVVSFFLFCFDFQVLFVIFFLSEFGLIIKINVIWFYYLSSEICIYLLF